MIPPPYLVIRKGQSFWVESRPLTDWTATPQAFEEGCFRDSCLLDTTGSLWQIVDAVLTKQPRLMNRLLPGRHLPVKFEISLAKKPPVTDILAELTRILGSGNVFSMNLARDPGEILERLKSATTPTDLIQIAGTMAAG